MNPATPAADQDYSVAYKRSDGAGGDCNVRPGGQTTARRPGQVLIRLPMATGSSARQDHTAASTQHRLLHSVCGERVKIGLSPAPQLATRRALRGRPAAACTGGLFTLY